MTEELAVAVVSMFIAHADSIYKRRAEFLGVFLFPVRARK